MACLLDTNIASEVLKKKNPHIVHKASLYLSQHPRFSISLMTRYEILRGLKAKGATAQLAAFENWCKLHDILEITDEIIVIAAALYAALKKTGRLIGDNDLIIAATALHHGLSLATGNVAHFSRIPGLTVEDWTQP